MNNKLFVLIQLFGTISFGFVLLLLSTYAKFSTSSSDSCYDFLKSNPTCWHQSKTTYLCDGYPKIPLLCWQTSYDYVDGKCNCFSVKKWH